MLCILINSSWQPQPADILDGVQHFVADVDPADGVLLSESVLTLGKSRFPLSPTAHGEPPADGHSRRENVLALIDLADARNDENGEEFSLDDDSIMRLIKLVCDAKMFVLLTGAYGENCQT